MNYELDELIKNAVIVRFIKGRRRAWPGHVMRMDDEGTPMSILEWKPIGMRIRGRPRKRWIVDIEEGMQAMGIRRRRESSVQKEQNGRESLRRPKPIAGCKCR
jgi:hypothetical protein